MRNKLQDKYMNSKYYEIIPMNRAIRAIQEKAIGWDETFADFEQEFFPSEKDIRRLAALQLKKFFLERDESTGSLTSVEEGMESGTDDAEVDEKSAALALTPMPSDMSPEKAHDMLTSVVQQEHENGNKATDVDAVSTDALDPTPPKSATEQAIQSTRDDVERDDVRHLDLALSSNFPDALPPPDEALLKTPTLPTEDTFDAGSPTPTSVLKVNPIDQSLADAIENMPSSPTPLPNSSQPLESKIPRPVDSSKREGATRPAMLPRTQSQPGSIPKHTPSAIGALIPPSSFQTSKTTAAETGKAADRMNERLGLGSSRQSKLSKLRKKLM